MNHKQMPSFGRYLKNVRIDKGISLKQISNDTRIGMGSLLAIEREDHDRLPAEVFVKGFIRGYAKSIGADPDEAVRRYQLSRRIFQETVRTEADLIKSSVNFWPRLLVSLGMLFTIMSLSVLTMSLPHTNDVIKETRAPRAISKKAQGISADSIRPTVPPGPPPPAAAPEKFLLKIVTVEKTWMKVIIDEQKSQEYSLNPGDQLELEALSGFNLLIGNAAGVQLHLNEKPLAVPGRRGQVVTLKIPR